MVFSRVKKVSYSIWDNSLESWASSQLCWRRSPRKAERLVSSDSIHWGTLYRLRSVRVTFRNRKPRMIRQQWSRRICRTAEKTLLTSIWKNTPAKDDSYQLTLRPQWFAVTYVLVFEVMESKRVPISSARVEATGQGQGVRTVAIPAYATKHSKHPQVSKA